jgi:hypothetical protein
VVVLRRVRSAASSSLISAPLIMTRPWTMSGMAGVRWPVVIGLLRRCRVDMAIALGTIAFVIIVAAVGWALLHSAR